MRKISFLIPAHNEEKIIGKTLQHLSGLPFKNYEVLVGLDGCTDSTEEIVKSAIRKNKKFKYFNLNIRKGKPEVIDFLIKKTRGDIIVINDADWIFDFQSKEKLNEFFSAFDDGKIGGIAESFPVEWDKEKLKSGNIGFKMVAYSAYYWMNYQKERFAYSKDNKLYVKNPKMFLTNVFRKKLYKKNSTLGDDFERTFNIINEGYDIIIFNDDNMPKMSPVYSKIFLKDLFKQKIRTAVARRQIQGIYKVGLFDYYIPSNYFILRKSFKEKPSIGFLMLFWMAITGLGHFASVFMKQDTKKGWTLRAER